MNFNWRDTLRDLIYQSISLPPSPRLLQGIGPPCQSQGSRICQPRAFDTHAVSYQNITTQTILLEKTWEDWLICQGRQKIEEDCKGMFSILCIHFFIAYQARITHERNSGAIDVNQRFFGYWIKFPLILFEEHPFIFIKLPIAVNFTAHYYFITILKP